MTNVDRSIEGERDDRRDVDPVLEEVAAMAAALHAYRASTPRAVRSGEPGVDSPWTRQSRLDGLRGFE